MPGWLLGRGYTPSNRLKFKDKTRVMIRLENLEVKLGGRTILNRLHLHVRAREKTVISGQSGSGKSTLLQTILGRYRPTQGEIAIDQLTFCTENLTAIRSKLFYLPQDIAVLGDETVSEFLEAPLCLAVNRGLRWDEGRVATLFDALGLRRQLISARMGNLSGGERKRVGLIQGLLLDRPILLLDELTSSVDEENRETLVRFVLSLTGTTVLAIAHDRYFIEHAERQLVLNDGRFDTEEA